MVATTVVNQEFDDVRRFLFRSADLTAGCPDGVKKRDVHASQQLAGQAYAWVAGLDATRILRT
jgi:hypothetical protein